MSDKPDPRVKSILDSRGIPYTIDTDSDFQVSFRRQCGRPLNVYINSDTKNVSGWEMRDIWSPALVSDGPIMPEISDMLLAKNHTCDAGSWGLLVTDENYVVAFKMQAHADTDETELLTTMQNVLTTAGEIEEMLTGKDEF